MINFFSYASFFSFLNLSFGYVATATLPLSSSKIQEKSSIIKFVNHFKTGSKRF